MAKSEASRERGSRDFLPARALMKQDRTLPMPASDALERHFSPRTLAEIWGLDESTIRRMFQEEPGVLKVGNRDRRNGKRDYVTLRIPESVVQRFQSNHRASLNTTGHHKDATMFITPSNLRTSEP